jgi:hypothetical protein
MRCVGAGCCCRHAVARTGGGEACRCEQEGRATQPLLRVGGQMQVAAMICQNWRQQFMLVLANRLVFGAFKVQSAATRLP